MVNLRNGSYNEKWIDFTDPQAGIELSIERHYSSRSLFEGVFGFGWCSKLETKLTITSDGIINLVECGGGLEVTYYPKDFDIKSSEQTIARIVEHARKNQKLSTNDLSNLRAQLRSNTKLRFEEANKLKLVSIQKIRAKKNVFISKSKGFEKITFNGSYYERLRADGSSQRFNKNGQLIRLTNRLGLFISIHYKGRRIGFLADNKGRRLNFQYGTDGKLQKISNGQGLSALYQFEGENLVQVTNMWSKTYQFRYDVNHNMTQVSFPDKTTMVMSYDLAKDWIKSYTNRKGCKETFNFVLGKADPQNNYTGLFARQCPGEKKKVGRHEFWYKSYAFSKDKYLHRVQENYDSAFKNVYFHPYLGKPVSIRENEIYQGFAYALSGLISKREQKLYTEKNSLISWNKVAFKYNPNSTQIREAHKFVLNTAGKVTSNSKTTYKYSKYGLLSKALDRKGTFVSVSYNENGKVSTLYNNRKQTLKMKYQPGVEKPVEIEQVNVGTVKITYEADGEVASIEEEGKRNIATSVVEKFIEMVSFLGPLGESLSI